MKVDELLSYCNFDISKYNLEDDIPDSDIDELCQKLNDAFYKTENLRINSFVTQDNIDEFIKLIDLESENIGTSPILFFK